MIVVAEGKKKKGETVVPTKFLQPHVAQQKWVGIPIVADGTALVVTPNLSLKEFQGMDLKLNKDGNVTFKQKYVLQTKEKVTLTAPGMESSAKIK